MFVIINHKITPLVLDPEVKEMSCNVIFFKPTKQKVVAFTMLIGLVSFRNAVLVNVDQQLLETSVPMAMPP